ncbi:hypothetical protein PVA19_19270 [Agrobacterium sp. CNPSo 3708]|nr:hypothetical protein [Agrobacterium sp. CNPSo 3708]MDD1500571.1 hypothetical protein [Agrobacterium sp. CNPSo 3708]
MAAPIIVEDLSAPYWQPFSPLAMGAKETEKAKFRYLIFLWKIT